MEKWQAQLALSLMTGNPRCGRREEGGVEAWDFSFPRRARSTRQISSFLPKGNIKRVAKPRLGLRPEAEDMLTYCRRAVSGGWTGTSKGAWLFTLYSHWEEGLCQWL